MCALYETCIYEGVFWEEQNLILKAACEGGGFLAQ